MEKWDRIQANIKKLVEDRKGFKDTIDAWALKCSDLEVENKSLKINCTNYEESVAILSDQVRDMAKIISDLEWEKKELSGLVEELRNL